MRRFFARKLFAVVALTAACSCLPGRGTAAQKAFAVPAALAVVPPKLDGTLDDPAWQKAAHVQLDWNFSFRRPAEERTDAYLLVDAHFIYVAFVVQQVEPITATQHTNDAGLSTDDIVDVRLWPGGDRGFDYDFTANPIGTRSSSSSENSAFAPLWTAVGTTNARGYVVTERIPLDVMRGDGRTSWRLQLERKVRNANTTYEWSHADAQGGPGDPSYAGYLTGMAVAAKSTRTKPRLQLYSLGTFANRAAGGDTSRVGADFSLPVTETSSFIGTLHPDYSNVELDQQTISPTAFARQFQEVRPFFTQGSNFYNNFDCNDCVGSPWLYTPAIPTPRDGFSFEGVQKRLQFGGFEALSNGRTDTAQSAGWTSPDRRVRLLAQRESVDMLGMHDDVSFAQAEIGNVHNFSTYVIGGQENGTQISSAAGGRYREFGVNLFNPNSGVFAAYHDVGTQYNPLDSFTQLNDVRGPTVFGFHEFIFGKSAPIQKISVSHDDNRFVSHAGGVDYTFSNSSVSIDTRTQFSLNLSAGETYILQGSNPGGYANQNGLSLAYRQNTSTPTRISYNIGRFGAGYLHAWARATSLRLGARGTLTLEADNTIDHADDTTSDVQWLERADIAYQLGSNTSFSVGARRIIGTGPPFFSSAQFTNATNLSVAYYQRVAHAELYFVYGDPNQLATQHSFVVKLIDYVGAQKGT